MRVKGIREMTLTLVFEEMRFDQTVFEDNEICILGNDIVKGIRGNEIRLYGIRGNESVFEAMNSKNIRGNEIRLKGIRG